VKKVYIYISSPYRRILIFGQMPYHRPWCIAHNRSLLLLFSMQVNRHLHNIKICFTDWKGCYLSAGLLVNNYVPNVVELISSWFRWTKHNFVQFHCDVSKFFCSYCFIKSYQLQILDVLYINMRFPSELLHFSHKRMHGTFLGWHDYINAKRTKAWQVLLSEQWH